MLQAGSASNYQNVSKEIVKNFTLGEVEKVTVNLQQTIGSLIDIKHNYLDHSNDQFNKKAESVKELIGKLLKQCTTNKAEQIQQISISGILHLTSCQGFKGALNKAEEVLKKAETVGLQVTQSLSLIKDDVTKCTKQTSLLQVLCISGLLNSVPRRVKVITKVVSTYADYAAVSLKIVVADVVACLAHSTNLVDERIASVFDEVMHCATNHK